MDLKHTRRGPVQDQVLAELRMALPRHSLFPDWLDLPQEKDWQNLGRSTQSLNLRGGRNLGVIHWPKKGRGQPRMDGLKRLSQ